MKMIATVRGMKRSQGMTEQGKPYDSTKLYIDILFAESPDMCGSATQEFTYGTYANYEKLLSAGAKTPFKAEIDFDFQTNGKTVKQVVVNVLPILDKPKAQ